MNEASDSFRVLSIVRGTTVDGPGFRTAIYLAGCTHCCRGCQNPQSWDFNSGSVMTLGEILDIVKEEDFDVTLSGGDPLCSPDKTGLLVDALKSDGRNVWVYTGFTWEEITANPTLKNAIKRADAVVEGPFEEDMADKSLRFKGSANQRIVAVKESLETGNIVILD